MPSGTAASAGMAGLGVTAVACLLMAGLVAAAVMAAKTVAARVVAMAAAAVTALTATKAVANAEHEQHQITESMRTGTLRRADVVEEAVASCSFMHEQLQMPNSLRSRARW